MEPYGHKIEMLGYEGRNEEGCILSRPGELYQRNENKNSPERKRIKVDWSEEDHSHDSPDWYGAF